MDTDRSHVFDIASNLQPTGLLTTCDLVSQRMAACACRSIRCRAAVAELDVILPLVRQDASVWIELIGRWTSNAVFAEAARVEEVEACEHHLGHPLPAEVRELLLETNGVEGEDGLEVVWPVDRIRTDNIMLRTSPELAALYMPFDPLLFFAEAGNGDQFAVVLRDDRTDVFLWDHETDSRTWAAPDLATYLESLLDGRLTD